MSSKIFEKMKNTKEGVIVELDVPDTYKEKIERWLIVSRGWKRVNRDNKKLLLGKLEVSHYGFPQVWYIWVNHDSPWRVFASSFLPSDAIILPGLFEDVENFSLNTVSYSFLPMEWIDIIKDLIE
jgi:hypothetical protein